MCGLKCYVVGKEGSEIANFYHDSHILGTKLQAYLFDSAIEAEDVGTLGDLSPNEYMEISLVRIEELPNSQEPKERRTKMQQDCRIFEEEKEVEKKKEEEDEEEEKEEDGSEESNIGQEEEKEDKDEDEGGEENNNDEDKLASQSDVSLQKLKLEKRRRLDPDIPAVDREVTQQSLSAHQSFLDIGSMQIEAIVEANPTTDSDIAMGNYLAPSTMAL
jgi:hypothetical protein